LRGAYASFDENDEDSIEQGELADLPLTFFVPERNRAGE
jgi:hypothetical protein